MRILEYPLCLQCTSRLPIIAIMILLRRIGTILFHDASDAAGRLLHWCFDGSLVALLPGAIHSPRFDDLHDRERGDVHLRRRHRPAGLGAVPDANGPSAGSCSIPNSRSAKPIWTAASSSSTARSRMRWRSCWTNPKWCRAGPGRNGGCAISAGTSGSSICAAARATMSRIITTSTAGSILSSSTPTGNIAAPISRHRTRPSTMPSSPRSATSPPSC